MVNVLVLGYLNTVMVMSTMKLNIDKMASLRKDYCMGRENSNRRMDSLT